MEIHAPHEPVRSLKDFLYHMLTVVLGILIALGLEALIEYAHHRETANGARESILKEMRDNDARLSRGLAQAPNAEQRLQTAMQMARNPKSSAASLDLSFGIIALSSTNWTAAQYSGALAYMSREEVQKLDAVYVLQQNFLNVQDSTLSRWLELQKWAPLMDSKDRFAGFSPQDLEEFKKQTASALIYLQTEENIAKSLKEYYDRTVTVP